MNISTLPTTPTKFSATNQIFLEVLKSPHLPLFLHHYVGARALVRFPALTLNTCGHAGRQ